MHESTFKYLKPTDSQLEKMDVVRLAFADLAATLLEELPEGPDKTYVLRTLRTAAMWSNVSLTRHQDGAPRVPTTPTGDEDD